MIAVDQIIGSGVVHLPLLRHRRDARPASVNLAHPVRECLGLLQGAKIIYQARSRRAAVASCKAVAGSRRTGRELVGVSQVAVIEG